MRVVIRIVPIGPVATALPVTLTACGGEHKVDADSASALSGRCKWHQAPARMRH